MFTVQQAFECDIVQQPPARLKALISPNYCVDEGALLEQLIPQATLPAAAAGRVTQLATELVTAVRNKSDKLQLVDALMLEYGLDTQEGVVLMCLAESLLRIPDDATVDALIRDKLGVSDWKSHLRHSESLLVNASTWGLMLTGKLVSLDRKISGQPLAVVGRLLHRLGEPVLRQAMHRATTIIARQFVLGRNIEEALVASAAIDSGPGDATICFSYDMLGEAAMTAADADLHFAQYESAIAAIGEHLQTHEVPPQSVSIKLSALHPRYEATQGQRVRTELLARLLELTRLARSRDVGITIDAEEADRLELSLDLFEALYLHSSTSGWKKLGLAVQAYSKRALPVLVWLAALAREQGDRIPVRLVKGAYWDSEIKWAQQSGLASYPVFTRKEATDTSYLACARFLLSDVVHGLLYPQFATHNAHTIASIQCLANHQDFELQRLYGMGESLYQCVAQRCPGNQRIYAPVGSYQDLLPYLARRLLENGANSSFVHRLVDRDQPVAELVRHPTEQLQQYAGLANPNIPLPPELFAVRQGQAVVAPRRNSRGCNIHIASERDSLLKDMEPHRNGRWSGYPIVAGEACRGVAPPLAATCPFDHSRTIGEVWGADKAGFDAALDAASDAYEAWRQQPVEHRAACLERAAELLEQHRAELVCLCQLEGGKILRDAIDEVREAVDFCRYYAAQARRLFGRPQRLPGVTGETNELAHCGLGVFACISPWNFPLAIFTGQIMAALVAGNCVLAKPARPTSLIACRAVQLFHQAGIPAGVLHLLTGEGAMLGDWLASDERIAGVAFTGSTATAHGINRKLAARNAPIAPLIAETGGQNAMIVDSTALPEQVIRDVLSAAFGSAGQRCSALRVLYLQEEVADRILELLTGAMQELRTGDPCQLATDVGPVINEGALGALLAHREHLRQTARIIAEAPLTEQETGNGSFLAPIAFEIDSMAQLADEHFGPILHVIRYPSAGIDQVLAELNQSGFGLTLGIHSRNNTFIEYAAARVHIGNIYVNRNQVGAVVGSQPFGGQRLSGTGPKAGGPNYLLRFATETTLTTNTSATGGNAELFR